MLAALRRKTRTAEIEEDAEADAVLEAKIAAMNVKADPFKPTAASQAEAFAREELYPQTGYMDATLMKDVRFKIGHALRNAGLHGTEYARELLCDPKRFGGKPNPAQQSSFSFGPDGV